MVCVYLSIGDHVYTDVRKGHIIGIIKMLCKKKKIKVKVQLLHRMIQTKTSHIVHSSDTYLLKIWHNLLRVVFCDNSLHELIRNWLRNLWKQSTPVEQHIFIIIFIWPFQWWQSGIWFTYFLIDIISSHKVIWILTNLAMSDLVV